jgi:hypothetical protein
MKVGVKIHRGDAAKRRTANQGLILAIRGSERVAQALSPVPLTFTGMQAQAGVPVPQNQVDRQAEIHKICSFTPR